MRAWGGRGAESESARPNEVSERSASDERFHWCREKVDYQLPVESPTRSLTLIRKGVAHPS